MVAQSKTELTISLSNVTVLDKGMYSCLHYIKPVTTKKVYVDVLGKDIKIFIYILYIYSSNTVS